MAFLSKIYIIACLLLNFLMWQEHPVYSLNQQHPETSKYPRSSDFEDYNPIRSSQMGIPICPAEDPNDVRFENYPAFKLNREKIVKDEDDGEDLDVAADDDDEVEVDFNVDDCSNTGLDDKNEDSPEVMARISGLMDALNQHIQAIVCNVKNIESQLENAKPVGSCEESHEDMEPVPKTKCSKKPKCHQDKQRQNQDDLNMALGEKLDTGLSHSPNYLQVHYQKKGYISPPGSGVHSQNREDITSLPGAEFRSKNMEDISPSESGIYSQNKGYISRPGSEIHSPNMEDISLSKAGINSQNRGDVSQSGAKIYSQNFRDISSPGYGIHLQNLRDTSSLSEAGAESPRISDLKIYPMAKPYNHKPYEEYETKLRRLMVNRDAIEKNVMKMLAPRHGERM
ncbi:hypothetical protein KR054_009768 [Drosophila jambulina]|nr:hypothetical protein KR054_009768 [Drosophila jambulina]